MADTFTKPLFGHFFVHLRNELGVIPADALELRGREREYKSMQPMHVRDQQPMCQSPTNTSPCDKIELNPNPSL